MEFFKRIAENKFVLFIVLMLLASCSSATPSSTTTIPTDAVILTETSVPTGTSTPLPTNTPQPTNTPKPTNTPRPIATPTPTPAPIIFSGNGDAVVDVEKWNGLALVHITYSGSRNFIVWNYGANNEKIDLLVNVTGKYEGTRPLDWLDGEHTTRFQVESSGDWEIQVLPFEQMRIVEIPGTFEGIGDDVIFLDGSSAPDLLKVDASDAERNFILWGWGNGRDLLVNEFAPYTGNILIDGSLPTSTGLLVLVVEATGSWSIEVTTR